VGNGRGGLASSAEVYHGLSNRFRNADRCVADIGAGRFSMDMVIGERGRISGVRFPDPGPLTLGSRQCIKRAFEFIPTSNLRGPDEVRLRGVELVCTGR